MRDLWWQMPGPARFIQRLLSDVQEGKSAVLAMPDHTPDGCIAALRRQLGDGETWLWRTVDVTDETGDIPARRVAQAMRYDDRSDGMILDARSLAGETWFRDVIVYVRGMTAAAWPAWKSFLEEYAHICRPISPIHRAVFLVPLIGDIAVDPPAEDVCLALHRWERAVTPLDLQLYTASIFPEERAMAPLLREVATAAIASLALWDPEVSEHLVQEELSTIFTPHAALHSLACRRGWDTLRASQRTWERGCSATFDQRTQTHSAALCCDLAQPDPQIARRIWRAQVSVIFPVLEEKRQGLLEKLQGHLRVPYQTAEHHFDLEIGQIYAQLKDLERQQVRHPALALVSSLDKAGRLRAIRNALAHLTCVTEDDIKALQQL